MAVDEDQLGGNAERDEKRWWCKFLKNSNTYPSGLNVRSPKRYWEEVEKKPIQKAAKREQISDLPLQRQGSWDCSKVSRVVLGVGKGDCQQGKCWGNPGFWAGASQFLFLHFQDGEAWLDPRGQFSGPTPVLCRLVGHLHRPSFKVSVPNKTSSLRLGRSWLRVPVKQVGFMELGRYAINERKEERKKTITKAILTTEDSLQSKGF